MITYRVVVEGFGGLYYLLTFQMREGDGDWKMFGTRKQVHSNRIQYWIDNWVQLGEISCGRV